MRKKGKTLTKFEKFIENQMDMIEASLRKKWRAIFLFPFLVIWGGLIGILLHLLNKKPRNFEDALHGFRIFGLAFLAAIPTALSFGSLLHLLSGLSIVFSSFIIFFTLFWVAGVVTSILYDLD